MLTLKLFPKAGKCLRPLYDVIDTSFFSSTKMFPTNILDQCKNNPNETQFLPSEVKVDLKEKATEQELFAQGVMIRRKESYNKTEKENTKNYNLQG